VVQNSYKVLPKIGWCPFQRLEAIDATVKVRHVDVGYLLFKLKCQGQKAKWGKRSTVNPAITR
jgi:hypothetical protein